MVRIDKNITINRPVDVVWSYLTNLENMPQWDRDVVEAHQTTSGPIGKGTVVEVVDLLIGKRTGELLITEFDPCNKFVFQASVGASRGHFVFTFEPNGNGTYLREVSEINLHGFLKLMEIILNVFGKKSSQKDFANLKRVLEQN